MMNDLTAWNVLDAEFNAEEFYLCIVNLLESNPKDPWCVSTLQWWNTYVFIEVICRLLPCL